MLVRPATPADIPAMMAIERHAVSAAHWKQDDYFRIFTENAPRRVALLLEDDGVVAFLIASVIPPECEIENVAVAANARRRGLGARLVGEFLDLARCQGARKVFLEVRESNAAARALYEKWAFLAEGRRAGYYSDPAEDALIYAFSFPDNQP
jgi:ribosomal-protein-alanine N-acetyltransferase